jgi:hypothetical protein
VQAVVWHLKSPAQAWRTIALVPSREYLTKSGASASAHASGRWWLQDCLDPELTFCFTTREYSSTVLTEHLFIVAVPHSN